MDPSMPPEALLTPEAQSSLLAMVTGSGPVVQGVLILLIVTSVWSWTVTVAKYLHFRRAGAETGKFRDLFWEHRDLVRLQDSARRFSASPLAQLFDAGFREVQQSARAGGVDLPTVERALRRAEHEEAQKLERGMTFLATVASSAPFVGLFGTVWGIMGAFHGLQFAKSTTIQAVAPGISEALVATAVGLAAAIPAAIAYNYCAVGLRRFRESMNVFTLDFLNVARQQSES
jgi:biopolymer transport protein TolQ